MALEFNINDSDKLDFNQEMASIVINVIETSLHKQFPTWKDFNLKMKDDKGKRDETK